jgi:hypothetical protein
MDVISQSVGSLVPSRVYPAFTNDDTAPFGLFGGLALFQKMEKNESKKNFTKMKSFQVRSTKETVFLLPPTQRQI